MQQPPNAQQGAHSSHEKRNCEDRKIQHSQYHIKLAFSLFPLLSVLNPLDTFFFFLHRLRTDSSGASVTLNEKRAWSLASTCTAQSYLHLQKTGCIYTISPTFFCALTCTKTQLHIFMCFLSLKQLNKSDYRQ